MLFEGRQGITSQYVHEDPKILFLTYFSAYIYYIMLYNNFLL